MPLVTSVKADHTRKADPNPNPGRLVEVRREGGGERRGTEIKDAEDVCCRKEGTVRVKYLEMKRKVW